ncbi:hypothetical protein MNBD_GAMMA16-336 [hydrothermal vent metagenome]|uniref:Uncharacterized protein n=1 Tax=hydrothermal vent metagenome TaxID=652676 RepID=A0A3B0ZHX7_9ZZZZ
MVSIELEEALAELNDSDLVKYAMKHLKIAYETKEHSAEGGCDETLQDILDCIFMECLERNKEWIFDKAQEGCLTTMPPSCKVPRVPEPA